MFTWAWRLGCGLVTLVAVAAIAAAVVVPRLAGATPYTVLTSSMRPGLPPGTLVVVRPVEVSEIGIGSVITYQLESGEDTVVTHRVVEQGFDGTGEIVLRTQGDANRAPDEDWVRPVQVRGEVWYAVPVLGHVGNVLGPRTRDVLGKVAGALLLLYAVRTGGSAWREWRYRPHLELVTEADAERARHG